MNLIALSMGTIEIVIIQDNIEQGLIPNTFVGVQKFLEERHVHLEHVRVRLLSAFSFRLQFMLYSLHCLPICVVFFIRNAVGPCHV